MSSSWTISSFHFSAAVIACAHKRIGCALRTDWVPIGSRRKKMGLLWLLNKSRKSPPLAPCFLPRLPHLSLGRLKAPAWPARSPFPRESPQRLAWKCGAGAVVHSNLGPNSVALMCQWWREETVPARKSVSWSTLLSSCWPLTLKTTLYHSVKRFQQPVTNQRTSERPL